MKTKREKVFPLFFRRLVAVGTAVISVGFLVVIPMMPRPAVAVLAPKPGISDFTPEVPIPGTFEGKQKVDNDLAGRYIRAIYVYFLWSIGILATIVVVYGGIKWVAAAGNPSRITDARDIINNAIIGIIIGLGSYLMLRIIDPRFVTLGLPPQLQTFKATPLECTTGENQNEDGTCKATSDIPCGAVCTDQKTGTKVYGECKYCDEPTPDTKTCGFNKQICNTLVKDGNCTYVGGCTKNAADSVCRKIDTFLGPQDFVCAQSFDANGFDKGGYTATTIQVVSYRPCGEYWWQRESKGMILTGFGSHPEKLFIGNSCPVRTDGSIGDCLIDNTKTGSKTVKRADIPDGVDEIKIGDAVASCH